MISYRTKNGRIVNVVATKQDNINKCEVKFDKNKLSV